ncbi:hypothetical protein PENSPDRAFT_756415 [Peniophora sp. CONT]|nr:hypothetical protein PENSPDRAFT_756415 [Peniophora sp. CONT]
MPEYITGELNATIYSIFGLPFPCPFFLYDPYECRPLFTSSPFSRSLRYLHPYFVAGRHSVSFTPSPLILNDNMRSSFVAFILFAVSAVPSLAAPIGDVEERALPAIIPGIIGVIDGLSHKSNKRIACGGTTGYPCPNAPFEFISARGVDHEERSIWNIPQLMAFERSLPKQMHDPKRDAGTQPLPCPADQPDCKKLYGIFPELMHPLDASRRDVNNKRKACLPNAVNCPEPYRPSLFGSVLKRLSPPSIYGFGPGLKLFESSDAQGMQSEKRNVILHQGLGKPVSNDMGAGSGVIVNVGPDDESDNLDGSQRRSFQTVGPNGSVSRYFASHPDGIMPIGGDGDNLRRSLAAIDKLIDSQRGNGLSPTA